MAINLCKAPPYALEQIYEPSRYTYAEVGAVQVEHIRLTPR